MTSLFDALENYMARNMSSFHVPGHKNNTYSNLKDLFSIDITELDDTDSLFYSSSHILRAEERTAQLFKAEKTLYSTGGATNCIQAMLRIVAPTGGKIICSRIIHISAVNTMALLGQMPCFVGICVDATTGFFNQPTANDIKCALEKNPDAKAVYITSPDYYGSIADIKGIAQLCKKFSVPLLVDAAHGSHLKFLPEKDLYPGDLGASMVALSAHKNLPVLTGGAWLNIHDRTFCDDAKQAMMMFASTSPSYPIMASLDMCTSWLKENGIREYTKLTNKIQSIKKIAESLGIAQPNGLYDDVRLCLNTAVCGLNAKYFAKHLKQHKIEPELYDDNCVVLISSPFNVERDFKRLEKALNTVKLNRNLNVVKKPFVSQVDLTVAPYEAIRQKSKYIDVKDAIGKISAQNLCPCPPGIPLAIAGEIIKQENILALLDYGIDRIKVLY